MRCIILMFFLLIFILARSKSQLIAESYTSYSGILIDHYRGLYISVQRITESDPIVNIISVKPRVAGPHGERKKAC